MLEIITIEEIKNPPLSMADFFSHFLFDSHNQIARQRTIPTALVDVKTIAKMG